jgi:hypothetical protein
MSRWIAAAAVVLVLCIQPALAAPRGPATSPEGNPVGAGVAAPATVPVKPRTPPSPPPPPPPTQVEGLVITARPATPPVETVGAFVADISGQTANGRLARWDRKICPGVIGLKPPYGQTVIDRISLVAITVGLKVGEPGCKPNMVIVATDDSQAMARMVVDANAVGFGKGEDGVSRGRAALKDFVETPRPVRWWHVTQTVTADGFRYGRGEDNAPPALTVRSASRIKSNTRDDFSRVIIMVDVTRVGVIRFEALTDYIAMVALAQIDPATDPSGVPTVLNLFSARDKGATPPLGLTGWDVAYLQSLYTTDSAALRGSRQERQMVRAMMDRLGVAADGTDAEQ